MRVWTEGGASVATNHQSIENKNPKKEMEGIKGESTKRRTGVAWESDKP